MSPTATSIPACRHRQPRRGGDARHQRHPRAQRRARRADPRDRALHRDRAPRAVRAPGRRAPLPRPRHRRERRRRHSAYLDYELLERALVETQADAAWVGWGFVAEHPAFAELCERLGIVFVGPDAAVMRALGDKIEAKRLAEQAGVPVAAWSGGPVESAEDAVAVGEKLGYPLMIKAASGGGGRGMRRVDEPDELADAFERARAEAEAGLRRRERADREPGRERAPRRGPADGRRPGRGVGARRARLQLPAPPPEGRRGVGEPGAHRPSRSASWPSRRCASRATRTTAARAPSSSSTSPSGQRFSFMEVNARLQVEHPVTEMVTGADLVALQLHVAAGGRLEGDPPPPHGHAIEVRLNAEDPGRGFAPAPGRITLLRLPSGPGVRVDTGVAEGDAVPPEFDSMIAKIIAHGADREQAIARLRRAVADTMVVIDEGTTNQGFLLELLGRPELRRGEVDTGWLDRLQGNDEVQPLRHADTALVQAAIALCDAATGDRARALLRARAARPPARRGGHLPDRRPAAPRHELSLQRLPGRPVALPRRGRRRPHRGRRRVGLRARAPALLRRALVPHDDRAAGPGPARRGQRRPAPRLARRGRPRAQPRARRRRRDPRR